MGSPRNWREVGYSLALLSLTLLYFIINVPFVITSLIFASREESCVTTYVQGFSFNFSTWLQVDAYFRILIFVVLLIVYVLAILTDFYDAYYYVYELRWYFVAFYSLFTLGWTTVGGVMFWDRLFPSGVCEGQLSGYSNALLIISFVIIWCYGFFSIKIIESCK